MILSLNSLKTFNENNNTGAVSYIPREELVDKIETQLGAIEDIKKTKDKYKDAVIVKVVDVKPIESTDKLTLCLIDDNNVVKNAQRDSSGKIKVVCGAPNVKSGMLAVWLPVGSIVPASAEKDPFVLTAKEIKGQVSNGMLASPKELDLFDSHEGILEIDTEMNPGQNFGDAYSLNNDFILNLENKMFTHRPDCFGLLGLAREIAGIQGLKFSSPAWYLNPIKVKREVEELKLNFTNELPSLVPRFTMLSISNVEVKPSPTWLQIELGKAGIRPINNVVDLSNYLMYLTAQPLHAYDYDKVLSLSSEEASIVVRNPKPNERLTLLNGKTITPKPGSIMIATDKTLIGVGGVMGGADTEVDLNTKNLILECATFDMYSTRRTAMDNGIFSDAVTRFTKGQSPLQNAIVISKFAEDITKLAGGHIASDLIDSNNLPKELMQRGSVHLPVSVTEEFVNVRLGSKLNVNDMARLLENVEFGCELESQNLTVKPPFWRTDIDMREDVVEEIGRLYGYHNLPLSLPTRSLSPVVTNRLLDTKENIRQKLKQAGANEVLTYSFVKGELLDQTGQDRDKAFKLANALSPALQYYRISLLPSLLEKVHPNIKLGYDQFALFELGKSHVTYHIDNNGLPTEDEYTAFVIAKSDRIKTKGSPYYEAKKYLEFLVNSELEFKPVSEEALKHPVTGPYDHNRLAMVSLRKNNKFLGLLGEIKPSVIKALKLPKYCAGFEIDTTALIGNMDENKSYVALPRFPYVIQDITLSVDSHINYQQLEKIIVSSLDQIKPANTAYQVYPQDIFVPETNSSKKHITFRIKIASYDKTLTDSSVNEILDSVVKTANVKIPLERV